MRLWGRALRVLTLACLTVIALVVFSATPAVGDVATPETFLDATPAAPTSATAATFTFHSDTAGLGLECQLDGGGFTPCTPPVAYNDLAIGTHTFDVRAVGDPTPATFSWEIVAIPDTFFDTDGGPSDHTTSGLAQFAFAGSPSAASFECALDGGPFLPCVSGYVLNSLSVAFHAFRVRAVNAAGTPDPTPAAWFWTVDAPPPGAPDTSIFQHPDAVTQSTDAAFVFGSETAGVVFQCQLDSAPWGACTGLPSVGAGNHTFEVRALNAGTPDPSPARYSWTVVPPDTAIDSTPPNPTTGSGAVFTFHATTSGADFQCARDGGTFATCVSGATLTGFAPGIHTFDVRARNAAGDLDPTPAHYAWTVAAGSAPPTAGASDPATVAVAPARPAMTTPTTMPVKVKDACAGKKGRKLTLCRADQRLKAAQATCAKLKGKHRSRCSAKAKAIRHCASLTGRKAKTCSVKARKLPSK